MDGWISDEIIIITVFQFNFLKERYCFYENFTNLQDET